MRIPDPLDYHNGMAVMGWFIIILLGACAMVLAAGALLFFAWAVGQVFG